MSIALNTSTCSPNERLVCWHELINQHHISVESGPLSTVAAMNAPDFVGVGQIDEWASMQVLKSRTSAVTYTHGVGQLRSASHDDFICMLVIAGAGVFEINGSKRDFGQGDLLFYDSLQLYTLYFPQGTTTITLRIPRPMILSRVPQADGQMALRMEAERPMVRVMSGLLKGIAELDGYPDPAHCREAEAPVLDVLCLAVRESYGETRRASPGQGRLLSRIKSDLIHHLGESELSIRHIAEMYDVSPRTLNRLFSAEGTTVMRWVWEQRLLASYRALSDGSVRQVTEAAYVFGFKDVSHFTRAFKREFQLAPSSLLTS